MSTLIFTGLVDAMSCHESMNFSAKIKIMTALRKTVPARLSVVGGLMEELAEKLVLKTTASMLTLMEFMEPAVVLMEYYGAVKVVCNLLK